MPLVEEHWFDEFYRVLVIRGGDDVIVSVDLYAEIPCVEAGEELRLGGKALRYVAADPSCAGLSGEALELLVLDGGRDRCELIGARLRLRAGEARVDPAAIYSALRERWPVCLGAR